jgi:CHASE3 domain sensor protein
MELIQNSQDLLYVVIAFCGLLFTVFSVWLIYYLAMIMRQAYKVVKETREKINKVDEILKALKEKIEHSASYLVLISEGVKKLVEVINQKSEKARKQKNTKTR